MRVRGFPAAVLVAALTLLAVTGSCEESEPKTGPSRSPLADGDRDKYGVLPLTVGGERVSRGAAAGYVPDQACESCHTTEYESYQSVGMARSFYPPDPKAAVETADLDKVFTHAATGYRYVMSIRAGKYRLRRYCVDSKGRRFAEHEEEVDWIIGSGNHVRSYLTQNAYGEMFQLPISWYRGKGFAMSPGYDRADHQRFERVIERSCMFCHNAYPEVPVGSDLPHRNHLFPTRLPHGIGCQRCHGPGARHIQHAEDPNASEQDIRRSISNPANFTARQREDLCMSCHLQPESVRSKMMPREFGRGVYSFQPGADLTKFITHLDHGSAKERSERFEINHHAYRLRQSRCYLASKGELSCLTCHNPHRKVKPADRAAYYRKKCMQCHEPHDCKTTDAAHQQAPGQSNCISCHMPAARPSDVIHVTVTDHLIRRKKPDRDLTAPLAEHHPKHTRLQIRPYFPDRVGVNPRYPLFKGFGEAYFPTAESNAAWLEAFERTKPHPISAYVTIGRGLLEVGEVSGATDVLNEAVEKFPEDAPARWTLGEALLLGNHVPAAVAVLEEAARLDRQDPGIQGALGEAYWRAGAREKARAALERSLQIRPNNATGWRSLGQLLLQMQDPDAALRALQTAIRWNPHDTYSYGLASSILASQRRTAEQFQLLEQGATLTIDIKLELIAARFLTRDKRFRDPKGGLALATAVARDHPANERALLYFALATVFEGRTSDAPRAIRAARTAGADAPSCTALSILYWKLRNDQIKIDQLLGQLVPELKQPATERLRARLLSHLRGLQIR